MSKLTFKSSEGLKALADKTLKTTFFKYPYTKETTKEKGLWLVKDEGIYLMKAFVGSKKEEMPIVYAEGFDPNKDQDVWDRSVDAVGGDDFALFLPFTTMGLNLMKKGVDTNVEVTDKYIEVTYKVDERGSELTNKHLNKYKEK